jgi:outer membrane protein assembly factor BamA
VATGAWVHRFYGFGNETTSEEELEVYQAFALEYRLGASAMIRMSPGFILEAGALYSLADPDENAGTLLAQEAPYGFEKFNSLSLTGALRWDGRDDQAWPTRGATLELSGQYFPELGDISSRFGKVKTVATGYLTAGSLPLQPTLAIRAGGEKIWGDFPYQEAAVLGGSGDLRGYPEERFSGDASLFFNSEIRLHLGILPAILPGSWGVMASTETGRVWLDGEDSDRWHGTYGGGFWASIIDSFTLTLSVARSGEGTRFLYGGGGFHF